MPIVRSVRYNHMVTTRDEHEAALAIDSYPLGSSQECQVDTTARFRTSIATVHAQLPTIIPKQSNFSHFIDLPYPRS